MRKKAIDFDKEYPKQEDFSAMFDMDAVSRLPIKRQNKKASLALLIFTFLVLLFTLLSLSACGQSSSQDGSPALSVAPVTPVVTAPPNPNNLQCMQGMPVICTGSNVGTSLVELDLTAMFPLDSNEYIASIQVSANCVTANIKISGSWSGHSKQICGNIVDSQNTLQE